MTVLTRTAAVVLTAAAVCAVGGIAATSASAAPAYSEETYLAYSRTLNGLQSVGIPDYTCPADHPWLIDQNLAPGRIVPPGVSVDEPGSVGVTIVGANGDASNRTIGWQSDESSATNWDVHSHTLYIYAHCTNDPAQTYQPGD